MKKNIIILLILFINANLYCQQSPNSIKIFNIANKEFDFKDSIPEFSIIIYYGEPICTECIEYLLNFINHYKISFYLVIEDRNDILYRKMKIGDFTEKSENIKAIFFDKTQHDKSLKNSFKLNRDFPILIFYDKKIKTYSNKRIFMNKDNLEINKEIRTRLLSKKQSIN